MPTRTTTSDGEVNRLYALPPEEFVAARDDLAKRRKAEGRAEDASEVKKLRRPSVAAWAVNQTVRQAPGEVDELLAAGDELRRLQRKAVSGVKAGGFREAMDRRRRAVASLTRRAERVLAESGRGSAGAREAVEGTFEAASIDQEAGERLRAGRLAAELAAPSGFGGGGPALESVPPPEEEPEPPPRSVADKLAAARREAKDLERAAADARRKAIRARAEADRVQERAARLAADADRARSAASEAQKEAARTERDAARAERDRAAAAERVTRLERRG
jgi:hypothetical protein